MLLEHQHFLPSQQLPCKCREHSLETPNPSGTQGETGTAANLALQPSCQHQCRFPLYLLPLHFCTAVWMLLAWHTKPLSATVISVFCLLFTEKTSHGTELAASIALLQEVGQGVGEPEDSQDNPPLKQRSCHGCPCHPSHPASELPLSA